MIQGTDVAGGGPLVSRACSSTAVDFGNEIWCELFSLQDLQLESAMLMSREVFDAADGTLGRLQQSSLKITNITRIFITHMHADHILGVVSILTQVMSGVSVKEEDLERLKKQGTSKRVSPPSSCHYAR